jgi:hypothetical protein
MEHIKKQKLEICQKTLSPLRLSNDSSFAGWTGLEHSHISPDRRSPIFTGSAELVAVSQPGCRQKQGAQAALMLFFSKRLRLPRRT